MKTFDELLKMDQATLLRYLETESEAIISRASPGNQLKLRAIQAKCDGIRARVKNPYYACELMVDMMMISAAEMAEQASKI